MGVRLAMFGGIILIVLLFFFFSQLRPLRQNEKIVLISSFSRNTDVGYLVLLLLLIPKKYPRPTIYVLSAKSKTVIWKAQGFKYFENAIQP